MFFNVRQLLDAGYEGKWYKTENDDELNAIVQSIASENLIRNVQHNKMSGDTYGDNLRHYIDRGHICVHGFTGQAEKHPLDVEAKPVEKRIEGDQPVFTAVK